MDSIASAFYDICTDGSSQTHPFITASPLFDKVIISNVVYTKVKNFRNAFYITFSLANRKEFHYAPITPALSINLGFLGAGSGQANTGYEKNILCKLINTADEGINYVFSQADVDSAFTKFNVYAPASLSTGSITGLGSYRVKCIGGRTGDATCTADSCGIGVTYFENTLSTPIKNNVNSSTAENWKAENKFADPNIKLIGVEFWELHGQLGIVTFSITPTKANFTFSARIYVEFPKQIPPRLNRFGLFTCTCLLYTSPSPRDRQKSRMPSSA